MNIGFYDSETSKSDNNISDRSSIESFTSPTNNKCCPVCKAANHSKSNTKICPGRIVDLSINCKSCHSNDHKTRSSKNCKYYIPRKPYGTRRNLFKSPSEKSNITNNSTNSQTSVLEVRQFSIYTYHYSIKFIIVILSVGNTRYG